MIVTVVEGPEKAQEAATIPPVDTCDFPNPDSASSAKYAALPKG